MITRLATALAVLAVAAPAAAGDLCDRDGYHCADDGHEPPSVDNARRTWNWVLFKDGYRVDLQRYDFALGRYVYAYRAGGRIYAWVEIGRASTGFLDADCDGRFEIRIDAGHSFTVPSCVGAPTGSTGPDAHCDLPGYVCEEDGFELPPEVGRYRDMPIVTYLRQRGLEREQAHLVEQNGLRKSMCGHRVGRESLVRVSGDGRKIRLIRYLYAGKAWTLTLVDDSGDTRTLVDSDGDGDYDTEVGDGVVIPCPAAIESS